MSRRQNPNDFLKQIIGRPVVVKLNSGVDYRDVLACLDGYMNIALEQTKEYVNGQLKNKYGDAFIRGNNVLYILISVNASLQCPCWCFRWRVCVLPLTLWARTVSRKIYQYIIKFNSAI